MAALEPIPPNEEERIGVLRSLQVFDPRTDRFFETLAKLAAELCGASIGLVNFVTEDRVLSKAQHGLPGPLDLPRQRAACAHAILTDDLLEIPDVRSDLRFAESPTFSGLPEVQFYASMPIVIRDEIRIGTVCVLDTASKSLSHAQRRHLEALAEAVAEFLRGRRDDLLKGAESRSDYEAQMEISNASMRALLDHVPAAMAFYDRNLSRLLANRKYREWFAGNEPELENYRADESEKTRYASPILDHAKAVLEGKEVSFETEVTSGGDTRIAEFQYMPYSASQGQVDGFFVLAYDVSDRKELEASLAKQHEKLRVTLQSIGDAVITTDTHGKLEFMNPVAERLTGWTLEQAVGRDLVDVFKIIDEMTRLPLLNPVEKCLTENRTVGLGNHTVLINRQGEELGVEDSAAPIRDSELNVIGVVLVFHDVSAQRLLGRQISHQATHDPLTGLLNRAEFESRLTRAFSSAREQALEHTLLYIDLDEFKGVNDACGHAVGDVLLQRIATLMESCVRAGDSLARLGGDEFAVILEQCNSASALTVAEKIRERIEEFRFSHERRRFRVGASIGLVSIDAMWSTTSEIIQAADSACYMAKQLGRNRIHTYDAPNDRSATHKREFNWAIRIEEALEHHGFELYVQEFGPPKAPSHPFGAEILLRMRDGLGGTLLPPAFLPAVERSRFSSRIDRWVIAEVLKRLEEQPAWQQSGRLITVNLSGQSIRDRDFRAEVEVLLQSTKANLSGLCFEIGEQAAFSALEDTIAFMERMSGLGIQFAIDNFGAGSSSFGFLRQLPVSYLKVDQHLTKEVARDQVDFLTVKSIVEISKALGKKTIATLVEDTDVLESLSALGVDFIQGFLTHQPEPLDDFLRRTQPLSDDGK